MERSNAAKNFASSSGEYVEVETSFNLGFGLFKSVCRVVEIKLGVVVDVYLTLSASDLVEDTCMSAIFTLLGDVCDLIGVADIMWLVYVVDFTVCTGF